MSTPTESELVKSTPEDQASEFASTASALVELAKPRVTVLVIATTLCGALSAPSGIGFGPLLASLVGTSLVVAAANGLNMVLERDTDGLMRRTRARPLPSKRLTPQIATLVSLVAGGLGLGMLYSLVGALASGLAAAAFVSYVAAYTPLKRITPLALLVGAVPGAIPPLIGWASSRDSIGRLALLQFGVLFVWQLPHFLAISVFRQDEYARAGLRVLPVVHGIRRTKIEIWAYSLLLVVVSLLPVALGLTGLGYAIVAIAAGLAFLVLATAGFSTIDDRRWARRLFFASMPYLVIVLGALAVFAS